MVTTLAAAHAYLAPVLREEPLVPDPDHPRLLCSVGAGLRAGLAIGTVLHVCLPRERPAVPHLRERVATWLEPPVQWAATLAVVALGEEWARCTVTALNPDLPEMECGVLPGMRVYLPRGEG